MRDPTIEELKFHWAVWESASKAFARRAVLGSTVFFIVILFQLGYVSINLWGVTVHLPSDAKLFYFFANAFSWLLLGHLGFALIDVLRHRVPDRFEGMLHNPNLTIGHSRIHLRAAGRILFVVIFPATWVAMAVLLGCTTYLLLTSPLLNVAARGDRNGVMGHSVERHSTHAAGVGSGIQ